MKAARVTPTSSDGKPYGFPGNVAPSSAIHMQHDVPRPKLTESGQLLIQVKASTVYKDNLEWNELYPPSHATLGNDFSGIVVEVFEDEQDFKIGDAVYGMTHANRGGTWAEFAIVTTEEAVQKPENLSWEEAAAIPGSAITADQALFKHVGLETSTAKEEKRVLITGAAGGIGTYLVRFAVLAGYHVIAASSSRAKNEQYLLSLGAQEVIEYQDFSSLEKVDVVVDSVGSHVLESCWGVLQPTGTLLSFDACSWGYREAAEAKGIRDGKTGINALYMIAEPSRESMARITEHVAKGNIKGRVLRTVPLEEVREAYESAHHRDVGHGKIVVVV